MANIKLRVSPGKAYVNGYKIQKNLPTFLSVSKSSFLLLSITRPDKSIKLSPKLGAEKFIHKILLCMDEISKISSFCCLLKYI